MPVVRDDRGVVEVGIDDVLSPGNGSITRFELNVDVKELLSASGECLETGEAIVGWRAGREIVACAADGGAITDIAHVVRCAAVPRLTLEIPGAGAQNRAPVCR